MSPRRWWFAVSNAGGLGSLPATQLSPDAISESIAAIRKRRLPLIFSPTLPPRPIPIEMRYGVPGLAPFFDELELERDVQPPSPTTVPVFGEAQCAALERTRPNVVSLHLGYPESIAL